MQLIPIESKQIAYVSYDNQSSTMTVHFHTGNIRSINEISREAYEDFLNANNKYDTLVQMTTSMSASFENTIL